MNQNQGNPAQARAKIEAMKRQFEQKKAIAESLSAIKYKIGVYSGKGGVGKTTVAVNLAVALAEQGHKVGLLDVDLPPGTSDAPLTVMQALEMDGFVIVTTPQILAKIDAKRSINMVRKLQIPILGVVENFSGDIFGSGAGNELSQEMDIKFFGHTSLRSEYKDTSRPALMLNPEILKEYETIVAGLFESLSSLE